FARQRADALVARLATLVVTVREPAAPGLALRIGEQAVPPAAEIRELVEPSDVTIAATLPGRPAFRATVPAVAGATLTVEMTAIAIGGAVLAVAAAAVFVAAPRESVQIAPLASDRALGLGVVGHF